MTRTIISLEDDDKAWLTQRASARGVPMTELVREAIARLRREEEASLEAALRETSGIWRGKDGLTYQDEVRGERE